MASESKTTRTRRAVPQFVIEPSEDDQALANRVAALIAWLSTVETKIIVGKATRDERGKVSRMLSALHGWDDERVRRMLVLEAIERAAAKQREEPARLRAMRDDRKRRGLSELSPRAAVRVPVAHIVQTQTVGVAKRKPSPEAIEAAVRAANRRGKHRSDRHAPTKWEAYATVLRDAGLGGLTAASVKQEWAKWRRMRVREAEG